MIELFLDQNIWRLTLVMTAPLLIAALGELITERSGVVNLGVEGIMAVAAAAGFIAAVHSGASAPGLLAGVVAGALLAVLFGYYTISLKRSQFTVGLTLFVLGLGVSSLMYRVFSGIRLVPPTIPVMPAVPVPWLADLPVAGPVLFQQNLLVYLALLLVPVLYVLLAKTSLGMRLRAVGENPKALDTIGLSVSGLRYAATIAGGALMGLAGAYLPIAITGAYADGMIAGRGWIALMIVIFARWSPLGALAGALLFAYTEALQFRLALVAQHIPSQFLLMLPYVVAIVVLVQVYRGANPPAALGIPYERESRSRELY
jgi:simple sugar transport system permease protein